MKITRDVIFDLLPAYFANEVSADTRALVDEFFATDPEFGRMAARFQTLLEEKTRPAETESARERDTFARARAGAELRVKARTSAAIWAMASAFGWLMAYLTWNRRMGFFNPGVILGSIFLVSAIVVFIASFYVTLDSPWRKYIGLDDETLKSI
jgi:hypothetical protein